MTTHHILVLEGGANRVGIPPNPYRIIEATCPSNQHYHAIMIIYCLTY